MKHANLKRLAALFALLAGASGFSPAVQAGNYAMIFSGGGEPLSNYDYYYTQTSRMWDLLVNRMGYDADNVYVLFSDGVDPGLDQSKLRTGYVNSDWSSVVNAGGHIDSATREDFQDTLQIIGNRMEPGRDGFMLWTFDHGNQSNPAKRGNGSLVTWLGDSIYPGEIGSLLEPISDKAPLWDAYVFNQCYAEDMALGLGITSGDANRFATWAATWDQTSISDGFADAWADGMESGLLSTRLLAEYAIAHDPYGPSGSRNENPGWVGGNFEISSVPEPSSGMVLALGLAAFVFSRKRIPAGTPPDALITSKDPGRPRRGGASARLLLVCALPASILTGRADPAADFLYSSADGKISITGYVGTNNVVTIPDTIEGQPVDRIAQKAFANVDRLNRVVLPSSLTLIDNRAFLGCSNLTNVLIPNGVRIIGLESFRLCGLETVDIPASVSSIFFAAFSGCGRLTEIRVDPANPNMYSEDGILYSKWMSHLLLCPPGKPGAVVIPEGINRIGAAAFDGCSRLTSVVLGESVTNVMMAAFQGCSGLTNLTMTDNVTLLDGSVFLGCAQLREIILPRGLGLVDASTFQGCSNLTTLTMPTNPVSIGTSAFQGCVRLGSVALGNSVTSIGQNAFQDCAALTRIDLPDGLKSIGNRAFYHCASLTNVVLPASLTSLGTYAFYHCDALSAVTVAGGINAIGFGTFSGCGALTQATLLDGIRQIASQAFYGCGSLAGVIVPNSVTNIGNDAFFNCTSLENINIPDSVTGIGMAAFSGCASLRQITIPEKVPLLWDDLFSGCQNLESVTINSRLTSIRPRAFSGCVRLAGVAIPETVTNIAIHAFENCPSLTHFTIPAGVAAIGAGAFAGCSNLTAIDVDPSNPVFCDIDGVLFDRTLKTLHAFPGGWSGGYVIPTGVETIGDHAFQDCALVTGVTFPGTMKRIGDHAFQHGSRLTSISLPDSVMYLGYDAFQGCVGLTNLTLPDNLASLGGGAFADCTGLSRVTIPRSVTRLGGGAFLGCTNLTGAYFEWNAPATGNPNVFGDDVRLTVYHRAGTTGWGASYCGCPTALWPDEALSFVEWTEATGLAVQCAAVSETDDPDGDGLNNLQEMQCGTDPTDPKSVLAFEAAPRPEALSEADKVPMEASQHALYFQSVPGMTYEVQSAATPSGRWTSRRIVTAVNAQTRVVLEKPASPEFYRLLLSPRI